MWPPLGSQALTGGFSLMGMGRQLRSQENLEIIFRPLRRGPDWKQSMLSCLVNLLQQVFLGQGLISFPEVGSDPTRSWHGDRGALILRLLASFWFLFQRWVMEIQTALFFLFLVLPLTHFCKLKWVSRVSLAQSSSVFIGGLCLSLLFICLRHWEVLLVPLLHLLELLTKLWEGGQILEWPGWPLPSVERVVKRRWQWPRDKGKRGQEPRGKGLSLRFQINNDCLEWVYPQCCMEYTYTKGFRCLSRVQI